MTDDQIEDIEIILGATFIKGSHGQYRFQMLTVRNSQIIFDTDDKFVFFKTESPFCDVVAFNLEELQNITKACEDVLEWY